MDMDQERLDGLLDSTPAINAYITHQLWFTADGAIRKWI